MPTIPKTSLKLETIAPTIKITGGKPLKGEVVVRGAKNSIPKLMVASLLTDEECILENISNVEDVYIVSEMIQLMGGEVHHEEGRLILKNKKLKNVDPKDLKSVAGKSRIPILFAGPLLHRLGETNLPSLGGCKIGKRPVDFHLNALIDLGAIVTETDSGFNLRLDQKLKGEKISLPYPSVGATEQVLLSAVLAEGVTELQNAAIEPEVMDLVLVLQKMGAIISVNTDRSILITGVNKLSGFIHSAITDRIEVASWACVAAATGGEIFVRNAKQADMITFLNKFREVGGQFKVESDGILFWRGNKLKSIALETDVHPGFMTDWQQPFTVLLTQVDGASIVHETVYENRFGYIETLKKMGANIQLYKECLGGNKTCRFGRKNYLHSAVITGPTLLHGQDIEIPDLRAGFSYIVAALTAEGTSTIHGMETISRGYENAVQKLKNLGADIAL